MNDLNSTLGRFKSFKSPMVVKFYAFFNDWYELSTISQTQKCALGPTYFLAKLPYSCLVFSSDCKVM